MLGDRAAIELRGLVTRSFHASADAKSADRDASAADASIAPKRNVSIVNGYLCLNCTDEALAKRQIDPRKGAAQAQAEKASSAAARGVNAPQAGAVTGGKLNLYA